MSDQDTTQTPDGPEVRPATDPVPQNPEKA
jgi:hypothetical protein